MELELMLAKRWDRIDRTKVKYPVYVEPKIDGIRMLIFKDGNRFKVVTRYAHVVPLARIERLVDGVYDSEGWKPGKEFNIASGEIRKGDLDGLVVDVFDYLTWEEWHNHESPVQKERRKRLEKLPLPRPLRLIKAHIAKNEEMVNKWFKYYVKEGYEGVMVKEMDIPYNWGRGKGWYKYKKVDFDDAEIIGFEPGTGRLKGSLGALVVRFRDGRVTEVGTGFTDEERDQIWKNKEKYIGKWIEVEFMEPAKERVRFPVFRRFKL